MAVAVWLQVLQGVGEGKLAVGWWKWFRAVVDAKERGSEGAR
jgi:hypothetical protein